MGAIKKEKCYDCDPNIQMKTEIERMKKIITDKIKDPKLAKKAALIIAEMAKGKGEK